MTVFFLDNVSENDFNPYLDSKGLLNVNNIPVGGYTQHPVTVSQIERYGYTLGNTVGLVYNGRNNRKKFRIIEITPGSMGWATGSDLMKVLVERIE